MPVATPVTLLLGALVVGLGGFFGAVFRYAVHGMVHTQLGNNWPYGTLTVNTIGCLAIGAVMAIAHERIDDQTRLLLVTGFLGSLTTFSTFGYESFALLREGRPAAAAASIAANVALGLVAVVLGWIAARALFPPTAPTS